MPAVATKRTFRRFHQATFRRGDRHPTSRPLRNVAGMPGGRRARSLPRRSDCRTGKSGESLPVRVSASPDSSPPLPGTLVAVEGEGGHRTLAAQSPREWAIVTVLAERFGHASAERALSGPGIEAMWWALASIDGARCDRDMTAADIARDAFARRDPIAQETIAVFTGFLGSVAGDLALTLGARGGVYIAGGIVPGWGERFDARLFLDRFRAKGRFRTYLSAIPVHVVTHPVSGARRGRVSAGTPNGGSILNDGRRERARRCETIQSSLAVDIIRDARGISLPETNS